MQLRQLRYFVVLAEELHFRRAAERLSITQSPLSVSIQTLEQELGALLFNRNQRRVELTEIGEAFRLHAEAILERVELSRRDVRDLAAGENGRLRLGFTSASSLLPFFPEVICAFRGRYPKVEVTLRDTPSVAQVAALHSRQIDLGLMRTRLAQQVSDITYTRLIRDRLVVAMRVDHRLADQPTVCIDDLRDESFLFYPPKSGVGIYDLVRDLCGKRGFVPRVVQEVSESWALVCLAATGLGIGVVPSEMKCVSIPGVVFKPIADDDAVTDVWLAARAGEPSKLIASFRHMLLAAAQSWTD
jgi:DNA-binding transcriptional LysR family regulator